MKVKTGAVLVAMMLCTSVVAQKTDSKNGNRLGVLIEKSTDFINGNKLSSDEMRKMMVSTFRNKEEDADFNNALDKYFPKIYTENLTEILSPYYSKELNAQQIDSLIMYATDDSLKHIGEGIAKCDDAEYRDKMVDETLTSIAQKTGKKKKKKNMKKFVADCTDDYRAAIGTYAQMTGKEKLSEDWVNAYYHTVGLDGLNAYMAYMSSDATKAGQKAEAAITEDIYNVRAACVSKFQTWSYKAYPSLFTKKQVVQKKRKGRKGKKTTTQQNDDTIIEGGIIY